MKTFSDILGQQQAIDWIARAYAAGRLPHGLIFAGPSGVGKASTAEALAGLFLCHHSRSSAEPCGQCESCRLMAGGTHPDYAVIYRQLIRLEKGKEERAAQSLSIDLIRQRLLEPSSLKPMLGHGRVFVIEEADLMSNDAQNALLKTLEEPGGSTLIILLTDQPESLLPTIRSRCQTVRFAELDPATVAKELARRDIDAKVAGRAAALAGGSLGVALRWIEDEIVAAADELLAMIDTLLAGRSTPELADWLKKASEAYAEKQTRREAGASVDQAKREGATLFLRLGADRFRKMLREETDPARMGRACDSIEAIASATGCLDSNVNIPIVLQQVSQALSRLWAA